MALRGYVTAVLFFVLIVGIGFGGLMVADTAGDSADRAPAYMDNESINQQTDLWQYVTAATNDTTTGFNESVTAYNASGAELDKGADFFWNATDGTIKYNESAPNVTEGVSGNVSYAYFEQTQDVQLLAQVVDPIVGFLSQAPLLAGGFALVLVLLAVATFVAKTFKDSGVKTNR